ncbi:serine protease inhibitor 5 RmS5-like protein, partial [Dinothrombium tinctorium]
LSPSQLPGGQLSTQDFAKSLNEFSLKFFKNTETSNKNVICSPFSVAICLGMLLKGARGQTAAEIKTVTRFSNVSNDELIQQRLHETLDEYRKTESENNNRNATVNIANRLLVAQNHNVSNEYKNYIANQYYAAVDEVDFARNGEQIKQSVNDFVNRKTKGEIKSVLNQPLPANTIIYLLNTIYFKGNWKSAFNSSFTQKRKFYNHDQSEVDVDTMSATEIKLKYTKDYEKKVTVVELPYVGNLSMILLVPQERYGLSEVLQNLNSEETENLIKSTYSSKITLKMPKFKSEYDVDARNLLEQMGLTSAFTPAANFSGITNKVHVSKIDHKAVVKVDESGTVAAAITSVTLPIARPAPPLPTPVVIVDHPFAFIIRDQLSGINIFYGVVNKF